MITIWLFPSARLSSVSCIYDTREAVGMMKYADCPQYKHGGVRWNASRHVVYTCFGDLLPALLRDPSLVQKAAVRDAQHIYKRRPADLFDHRLAPCHPSVQCRFPPIVTRKGTLFHLLTNRLKVMAASQGFTS